MNISPVLADIRKYSVGVLLKFTKSDFIELRKKGFELKDFKLSSCRQSLREFLELHPCCMSCEKEKIMEKVLEFLHEHFGDIEVEFEEETKPKRKTTPKGGDKKKKGGEKKKGRNEEKLREKAKKLEQHIEPRLLAAFKRIRKNARNGLAVVYIQRDACGGCFNKIPPQRQLDIKLRKKIIVCEYCGRIMIDPELAGVE